MTETMYDKMFKPEGEKPPEYVDRSTLEAFAKCPQQGYLIKQHEKELVCNEVLPVVGSFVHQLAKEAIEFADKNIQEASDYFAEELSKARPDIQPEVIRAGRHLANQLLRFQTNAVLICEEQITRSILPATPTKGELLITTKPDLALATNKADTIIVLDWKSGWKERTNADALDEFQTCVICWALKAKYPEINTLHFYYLNTRRGTIAYAKIELNKIVGPHDLTQESAFYSRILEAVKLWQSENKEAWPEPEKCQTCPVLKFCELADPTIPLDFQKSPDKFLDRYIVADEELSRMEKILVDACKTGRTVYNTNKDCWFDDSLKRKQPFRASLKSRKIEKDIDSGE